MTREEAKRLAEVRQRDGQMFDHIPEHWQGPLDRRFLLELIDKMNGVGLGWPQSD